MAKEKRLSKIRARQMKAEEEDRRRFNIVGHRRIWYILSLLVIIPGIFCMVTKGFNFGIDFTGGTIIDLRFDREVAITEVRDVLKDYKLDNSTIQLSGETSSATSARDVMIRTGDLEEDERKAVMASLRDKLGSFTMLREEKVGAAIGSELVWNAVWATLISWVLIVLYISFRFEWKFGIAAVLALVHDVLILLSVFSLLQKQLDSSFVAALMTIVGYSINDTIVIFDRIREMWSSWQTGAFTRLLPDPSIRLLPACSPLWPSTGSAARLPRISPSPSTWASFPAAIPPSLSPALCGSLCGALAVSVR